MLVPSLNGVNVAGQVFSTCDKYVINSIVVNILTKLEMYYNFYNNREQSIPTKSPSDIEYSLGAHIDQLVKTLQIEKLIRAE